ncbi:MAG: ferritin-like domain-containing protein [Desulfobacterales bacterium]|nr:ferritin-like domain-containing protein [Desulfobacterales bacterium]MBS3756132.1 ferritin-like domain-containing protein [Desulfobacterales bacterium]
MEKQELVEMLNRDIGDEHAAILRYLIHSYLEGEDTPIGAKLLSRAREEMWHMHWLGMLIGALGGEPDMEPAEYPYDPTNRATILKSYVAYEKNLVPHYEQEAERVTDPHIKRVLQREAWESEMHAEKFQKMRDKLSQEEAAGIPGEENELPEELRKMLQESVAAKYRQMLQTLRDAWVFQDHGKEAWQRMDFSMTKMKQLAHSSEEVAENGLEPDFTPGIIDSGKSFEAAIDKAINDLQDSLALHRKIHADPEAQKHGGLMSNLDLTLRQEQYEAEELQDLQKKFT